MTALQQHGSSEFEQRKLHVYKSRLSLRTSAEYLLHLRGYTTRTSNNNSIYWQLTLLLLDEFQDHLTNKTTDPHMQTKIDSKYLLALAWTLAIHQSLIQHTKDTNEEKIVNICTRSYKTFGLTGCPITEQPRGLRLSSEMHNSLLSKYGIHTVHNKYCVAIQCSQQLSHSPSKNLCK